MNKKRFIIMFTVGVTCFAIYAFSRPLLDAGYSTDRSWDRPPREYSQLENEFSAVLLAFKNSSEKSRDVDLLSIVKKDIKQICIQTLHEDKATFEGAVDVHVNEYYPIKSGGVGWWFLYEDGDSEPVYLGANLFPYTSGITGGKCLSATKLHLERRTYYYDDPTPFNEHKEIGLAATFE